jgi:hypothetical protein
MTLDNKNTTNDSKFDGVSDVDRGEKIDYPCPLEPNKFPRESGSDSYSGIPGDGVVPG